MVALANVIILQPPQASLKNNWGGWSTNIYGGGHLGFDMDFLMSRCSHITKCVGTSLIF